MAFIPPVPVWIFFDADCHIFFIVVVPAVLSVGCSPVYHFDPACSIKASVLPLLVLYLLRSKLNQIFFACVHPENILSIICIKKSCSLLQRTSLYDKITDFWSDVTDALDMFKFFQMLRSMQNATSLE